MRGGRSAPSAALLSALLALGAAACGGPSTDRLMADMNGTVLEPPFERPDFTFADASGERWDFRTATEGKTALVFFGYTSCPDVCPVTMARLAEALDSVPADVREATEVVFVAVDPRRDTPERIGEWLGRFDSTFVGVTAEQERVDELLSSLHFPPAMFPDDSASNGEDYLVGHPGQVLAFTPDGEGRLLYSTRATVGDYVADLTALARHDW